MKPKLYLHVGLPKAGSSTIQKFLEENWEDFHRSGYLILNPKLMPYKGHGRPPGTIDYFKELRDLAFQKALIEDDKRYSYYQDLFRERFSNAAANGLDVILSAENLTWLHPLTFKLLLSSTENFDLKVIIYLRRQDLWLESAWKQWFIQSDSGGFGAWLQEKVKKRYIGLLAPFGLWAGVLDEKSIFANILDKKFLKDGSLIEDFCGILGYDSQGKTVDSQNEMIHRDMLTFLYRRNSDIYTEENVLDVHILMRQIEEKVSLEGSPRIMSEEMRRSVLAAYKEDNIVLVEKYFSGRKEDALKYFWLDGRLEGATPLSQFNWEEVSVSQTYTRNLEEVLQYLFKKEMTQRTVYKENAKTAPLSLYKRTFNKLKGAFNAIFGASKQDRAIG